MKTFYKGIKRVNRKSGFPRKSIHSAELVAPLFVQDGKMRIVRNDTGHLFKIPEPLGEEIYSGWLELYKFIEITEAELFVELL